MSDTQREGIVFRLPVMGIYKRGTPVKKKEVPEERCQTSCAAHATNTFELSESRDSHPGTVNSFGTP